MFSLRLSCLRQSIVKRNFSQIKNFSNLTKTQTKSESKVKEIKDFVINQSKWDSSAGDLKKPVLLYANENTRFYQKLFILNVCQFFFWMFFANQGFSLTIGRPKKGSDPLATDGSFIDKMKLLWKEKSTQLLLSAGMLICGQISISLVALFCIRSVRYIILKPGGQSVRITTFSITGSPNRYRHHDLPLDHVSSLQYRNTGVSYLPLKLKNKWFFFLVDSKGHFYRPALFDQTVGVFRIVK